MSVKPSPPVRKLVVLENSLLTSLAHNREVIQAFPFLKKLAGQRSADCGTCNKQAKQEPDLFTQAKSTIAGMGDDKKRQLKRLLNAKQARVTYRSGSRTVQHTF